MTERQIEADETPCPLTVSDWIALLAAESQTIHGYKYLVVTLLLAALSIWMKVFTGTSFKTFGLSELLISVIFVAVLYYAKRTMDIFKEEYENSKTIEEIISGDLTDSDEIRKQYYERRKTPDQM